MKLIIGALLAITATTQAQTFLRLHYPADGTNILVPANTLLKIVTVQDRSSENLNLNVVYPDSTNVFPLPIYSNFGSTTLKPEVLGPANVFVYAYPGQEGFITGEITAVNVTPAVTGFAVQPSNIGASVTLESSTNLVTWSSATNGVYDKSTSSRFFRLNLQVR